MSRAPKAASGGVWRKRREVIWRRSPKAEGCDRVQCRGVGPETGGAELSRCQKLRCVCLASRCELGLPAWIGDRRNLTESSRPVFSPPSDFLEPFGAHTRPSARADRKRHAKVPCKQAATFFVAYRCTGCRCTVQRLRITVSHCAWLTRQEQDEHTTRQDEAKVGCTASDEASFWNDASHGRSARWCRALVRLAG